METTIQDCFWRHESSHSLLPFHAATIGFIAIVVMATNLTHYPIHGLAKAYVASRRAHNLSASWQACRHVGR
jgi:hypothetical protein